MLHSLDDCLSLSCFGSLRGGPDEAYTAWHGTAQYRCVGHAGVDFNAPLGTPVYCMKGGVIHWYGPTWGHADDGYAALGMHAVVTLPSGETHWYAHLGDDVAAEGAAVADGQLIAHSGATGNVSGPHLHAAVRPATPDYGSGFDGFIDFLTHFDHDVFARLNLELV